MPSSPFGGAQRLVIDLARLQNKTLRRSSILLSSQNKKCEIEIANTNIDVIHKSNQTENYFQRIIKIRRAIKSYAPNIIHLHIEPPWMFFALIGTTAKTISHFHTRPPLQVHQPSVKLRVTQFLSGLTLTNSDCAIAISHWIKAAYLQAFLRLKTPIKVVYNGVKITEHSKATPISTAPVFGIASRIAPLKGLEEFLVVAKAISKRYPKAKYKIAGTGNEIYTDFLKSRVISLGLTDKVEFLGFISDISTFWDSIDISIFTPPFEPFGLRLIEPASHGIPVLAYKTKSGSDEIIDRCALILSAEYNEAQNLVKHVEKIINNPQKLYQLRQQGRKDLQEFFSIENMAQSLDQIYEIVLK